MLKGRWDPEVRGGCPQLPAAGPSRLGCEHCYPVRAALAQVRVVTAQPVQQHRQHLRAERGLGEVPGVRGEGALSEWSVERKYMRRYH